MHILLQPKQNGGFLLRSFRVCHLSFKLTGGEERIGSGGSRVAGQSSRGSSDSWSDIGRIVFGGGSVRNFLAATTTEDLLSKPQDGADRGGELLPEGKSGGPRHEDADEAAQPHDDLGVERQVLCKQKK